MKAIVVRQPWATLIALEIKTLETRPFPPNGPMRPEGVRGLPGCSVERGERIAIVAGAAKPSTDDELLGGWEYEDGCDQVDVFDTGLILDYSQAWAEWRYYVRGDGPHRLPLGAVVCTVTVDEALPVISVMQAFAGYPWWPNLQTNGPGILTQVDDDEGEVGDWGDQLPLGDFSPGRWGWLLGGVKPCEPVPCKAKRPDGTKTHMQGVFLLPDDVAEQVS